MVDPDPPRTPRLMEEALVTGTISGDLSAILAGLFQTVCKDGTALTPDKRSVQGVYSFLVQLM